MDIRPEDWLSSSSEVVYPQAAPAKQHDPVDSDPKVVLTVHRPGARLSLGCGPGGLTDHPAARRLRIMATSRMFNLRAFLTASPGMSVQKRKE
jgi:hypothetical protein